MPNNAEPIVIIDKDKEQQTNSVELMIKHDVYPASEKGHLGYLIYNYVKQAAMTMLNNRMKEKALDPSAHT